MSFEYELSPTPHGRWNFDSGCCASDTKPALGCLKNLGCSAEIQSFGRDSGPDSLVGLAMVAHRDRESRQVTCSDSKVLDLDLADDNRSRQGTTSGNRYTDGCLGAVVVALEHPPPWAASIDDGDHSFDRMNDALAWKNRNSIQPEVEGDLELEVQSHMHGTSVAQDRTRTRWSVDGLHSSALPASYSSAIAW